MITMPHTPDSSAAPLTNHVARAGGSVGDVLQGRYVLETPVGSGAMATVYRATDLRLRRTVAVKVFDVSAGHLGEEARHRAEATLLATVDHHALVTLYDGCFSDGSPNFLVLEFIEGGALSGVIASDTPLDTLHVASLAEDLAEALAVVHDAGIVHRDVKPGNILLRAPVAPGKPVGAVLGDFGIAHAVDGERLTSPGIAVGTAAYMAPEQVRGAPPAPPSDIYSLGLVLLEALTGERVYAQMTPIEAIAARLTTPPTIPTRIGSGWASLIRSMTASDPLLRPSARDVSSRARELARLAPASSQVSVPPFAELVGAPTQPMTAAGPVDTDAAEPLPSGPVTQHRRKMASRVRWRVTIPIAAGIAAGVLTAMVTPAWPFGVVPSAEKTASVQQSSTTNSTIVTPPVADPGATDPSSISELQPLETRADEVVVSADLGGPAALDAHTDEAVGVADGGSPAEALNGNPNRGPGNNSGSRNPNAGPGNNSGGGKGADR